MSTVVKWCVAVVVSLLLSSVSTVDAGHRPSPTVCTSTPISGCISPKQARRMGIPIPAPVLGLNSMCMYPTQTNCVWNATMAAILLANRSKDIAANVNIPVLSALDDYGERLLHQEKKALAEMTLKGCMVNETFCGQTTCMCLTPGSWIGSFLTMEIASQQRQGLTRLLMPILPGSGDISVRRFWEAATGFVSGSMQPEMGAVFDPNTGTYTRNCGGIRDDSEHITFTAHTNAAKCDRITRGSLVEPELVASLIDMANLSDNLTQAMQASGVILKVIRNPIDQFGAYLQQVSNLPQAGDAAQHYLQNPGISDLPMLQAAELNLRVNMNPSEVTDLMRNMKAQSRKEPYNFDHWFKNQWLPYSAGGNLSSIHSPNAQTYVMRYEDLQRDPHTTLLDFIETTGVGQLLGLGTNRVGELLKANDKMLVLFGEAYSKKVLDLKLEPMGKYWGRFVQDAEALLTLQEYSGLMQQYGYLFYPSTHAMHIHGVDILAPAQLKARQLRSHLSTDIQGGRVMDTRSPEFRLELDMEITKAYISGLAKKAGGLLVLALMCGAMLWLVRLLIKFRHDIERMRYRLNIADVERHAAYDAGVATSAKMEFLKTHPHQAAPHEAPVQILGPGGYNYASGLLNKPSVHAPPGPLYLRDAPPPLVEGTTAHARASVAASKHDDTLQRAQLRDGGGPAVKEAPAPPVPELARLLQMSRARRADKSG